MRGSFCPSSRDGNRGGVQFPLSIHSHPALKETVLGTPGLGNCQVELSWIEHHGALQIQSVKEGARGLG